MHIQHHIYKSCSIWRMQLRSYSCCRKQKMRLIGILFGVCAFFSTVEGGKQSVGVRGQLRCGDLPLANTVVKLWEIDTFGKDDVLGCVKTDSQGKFEVKGTEGEFFSIEPVLKIYTNCNDKMLYGLSEKPCQRKIKYEIPKAYINQGELVEKWFEFGVMNLELKQNGEDRKCSVFDICDGIFGK